MLNNCSTSCTFLFRNFLIPEFGILESKRCLKTKNHSFCECHNSGGVPEVKGTSFSIISVLQACATMENQRFTPNTHSKSKCPRKKFKTNAESVT